MSARILVVDDKANMRSLLADTLRDLGEVVLAEGGPRALELLESEPFDVVVTDVKMPHVDGHAILRAASQLERPPFVILMTGFATVESAVEAFRGRAFDYVTKPFDPDRVREIVARALSERRTLPKKPPVGSEYRGLVGISPQMRAVFEQIERVASEDTTVLLQGESGTGKELLAHALHAASSRASQPFVVVSSAAIPSTTMEAELFGDASSGRPGLFEEANGGTLFLDEIGEMRRALQPKLTRALEEKSVRRVGEAHERLVDVRIVAATHRDLQGLVAQGAFREDLYFRLSGCVVTIPPLRDRVGDLELLVGHFLALREKESGRQFRIADDAWEALHAYRWPGNVRELRSAMEHATRWADDGLIRSDRLPPQISSPTSEKEAPLDLASLTYRDAVERVRAEGVRRYLQAILERFGGNVAAAAEHADLERESFYRLCRRYQVLPTSYRGGGDDE